MKQLTKEQLTDLVYDSCKKTMELNLDSMQERLQDSIKGSEGNCAEWIVKLVVAYGAEIMSGCNQVLAETLYNILYADSK